MMNALKRALDRLALYFPAILMALFALGSWWLVKSLPGLFTEPQSKQVRHEPDYFLEHFSVKSFDSKGRLTRELSGDRAQHFPDTETLDISNVQLRTQNPNGDKLSALAERAVAKSDGSEVRFKGNVQFTQPRASKTDDANQSIELRSQELTAFLKEERLVSLSPVEIRRGADVFSADRMEMNSKTGEFELTGKVRGAVQAQKR